MQTSIDIHTIPARPEGPLNPAEVPVARLVLATSQADLIEERHKPTLFRRLKDQYEALKEELWHELFGSSDEPTEAAECRVIEFRQTA